jgi:hypothetical protein
MFLNHIMIAFCLGFNERQLVYDVVTRWNSTFYMLQRFVEEKTSISACLNEKAFQRNLNKAKVSKNVDWDMQEQLMVKMYKIVTPLFRFSVYSRAL